MEVKCEECGKDTLLLIIIPKQQADGKLITLVCLECAETSGFYCTVHDLPHLGFVDGSSACTLCIDEQVTIIGEQVGERLREAISPLPNASSLRAQLMEWAEEVGSLTQEPINICLGRAVITLAQRRKTTPKQIIQEVKKTQSINQVLPPAYQE